VWVTTLNIVLASLLAALACLASGTRKLEARLGALAREQGERRRRMEGELARVRQCAAEMANG
jgi:hypothetical protein